jgi:hypothetical protein
MVGFSIYLGTDGKGPYEWDENAFYFWIFLDLIWF